MEHGQGRSSHGIGFYPTGIPSVGWVFAIMLRLAARKPWYIRFWRWIWQDRFHNRNHR